MYGLQLAVDAAGNSGCAWYAREVGGADGLGGGQSFVETGLDPSTTSDPLSQYTNIKRTCTD